MKLNDDYGKEKESKTEEIIKENDYKSTDRIKIIKIIICYFLLGVLGWYLANFLFHSDFLNFVEEDVVSSLYNKFKNEDAVFYSHAVSMLLTLSVWFQKSIKNEEL